MYKNSEKVTLIGVSFRIFHVILVLGSAFLLYSALGLDDDEVMVEGAMNMFYLHRNVGLVWGGVILIYALYAVLRKRKIGILEPLGKSVGTQVREAFSIIGRYFFGQRIPEKVRVSMGRHNILASYAFLFLVLGLLLLGAGGLGLIFYGEDSAFGDLFLGAHILGAGILAFFVLAHFFAVINKENRPLLFAVFTNGRVKKEWVERSMPKYAGERYRR